MDSKELKHLYWRSGFGINLQELNVLTNFSKKETVDKLITNSKPVVPLKIDVNSLKNLSFQEINRNEVLKRDFLKKSREKLKIFNLEWVYRMTNSTAMLRERMTLFWANHFVVEDHNIIHFQKYNNTLREYALGDFRAFVKAISKEASMIKYLDLKQNKKNSPNENFSRELMELFTLGVGNYTSYDIKEASKAFTGYSFEFNGKFKYDVRNHDDGFKHLFGRSGRYDGDDVIDIILDQKQCAEFICRKIYAYFVNKNIVQEYIDEMTSVFYPGYNIEELMRFIFMSDWFYNKENIGTKIKSPTELLIGIQKIIPIAYENPVELVKIQRLLGQPLLNPPNVSGWEGGKSWITSNTILLRLKTASLLLNNGLISVKEKGDFYDRYSEAYKKRNKGRFFKASVNWEDFDKNYQKASFEDIKNQLILTNLNLEVEQVVDNLNHASNRDSCIQIMSLPEYQMC
ncbi:DUF1800 domain-containing protein [Hanstruepera marina]|uniref:DUF1800 domain-containing protein n=1 Tax=Hanstruepera marina TaxID=2873265 RepID=UPI001CA72F93|nr:DUF1800 domain-containing protein [Hanstruepera marina]